MLLAGAAMADGAISASPPPPAVPNFAKAGLPGQEREVVLELKLLADVGLVGFPNVGKSTLLSGVQGPAQDRRLPFYHPLPQSGRGLCGRGDSRQGRYPGIIEGAAEDWGMTSRHVDRCRLLIHIVDVSGRKAGPGGGL